MLRIDLQWKILVLLPIFSMVLCDWVPKKPENHQVCRSQSCIDRGNEYFNNMMRNVNPCEDFYTFACGAWEKNHPRPPYTEWDVAYRMDEDTLTILKKLLEELPPQTTDNQLAKLQFIYKTCLDIPYFDKHRPEEIKKEIERIRRYPVKQLWDRHNEYLKLTGESALFDLDVGNFDDHLELPMLQFAEPQSPFGSIYHHNKWQPSEELSYTKALFEMLSSLGLSDSPENLKKRIFSVYQFRRKLNLILSVTYELQPDIEPMQMSPFVFEKHFAQFAHSSYSRRPTIAIPWEQIAKILFHNMSPLAIKKRIIILYKVEYFKRLANLLAASTEEQIADHMEIYFVERHLNRTQQVKQLLKETWKDPPATVQSLRYDEPRWMTCIKESDMTPTLAKLFIDKWFKTELKHQVTNILGGIKTVVKTQVTQSKWLDNNSKDLTVEALNKVEELIAIPTRDRENYSPVRSLFPNVFLDFNYNIMFMNAAMLQSPVFNPNLPVLYNIGSTGFLLGHEFYHVIDDCGSRSISKSESLKLWPEKMRKKCLNRKNCFITEYNKYTQLEFNRRYKLSPKIDTTDSFIENLPDVMGLEAAHIFHSKILKRDGGQCFVLPGFEGYSCDQMFFITFANIFCGIPPAKIALADLKNEIHSINPVRINGALSSTQAFANAFQCGKKDTMNPSIKCNLWI